MHDKKWQYKVETVKAGMFKSPDKADKELQDRLNRLGLEGWELVSVTHDGMNFRVYLKR